MNNNPGKFKIITLTICFIFILAGISNYGFSRFLMSIPFFILALIISIKHKRILTFFLCFSILGGVFNLYYLESSPLFFPILNKGEITLIKDGYFCFNKNAPSSGFNFTTEPWTDDNYTCNKVLKGEKFKIDKISIRNPDFATKIYLESNKHSFSSDEHPEFFSANKIIYDQTLFNLSLLMFYPLFPSYITSYFYGAFPSTGISINVKDHNGVIRKAKVNYLIGTSWEASEGDNLELDCDNEVQEDGSRDCVLKFLNKEKTGFSELGGFHLSIDKNGTPEPSILNYLD